MINWIEFGIGAVGVVALWAYDKNLLERAKHRAFRASLPLLWKGLSVYNRVTGGSSNQQKLLSDGYKVTKIVYEKGLVTNNPSDTDIQRAISGEIQDQYIEIQYTFDFYRYRMIIPAGVCVTFPPYPSDEIREKEHQTILAATVGEKDYTSLVTEYSGPKGNFYKDLGIEIKPEWMIPNLGPNEHLSIVDFETTEYHLCLGEILEIAQQPCCPPGRYCDYCHSKKPCYPPDHTVNPVSNLEEHQSPIDSSLMAAILESRT